MKKKSILFALAAVCLPLALSAQKEREITLNEAIAMARIQSVDAAVALNELKTAYWEFRTFRADLLPEIVGVLRVGQLGKCVYNAGVFRLRVLHHLHNVLRRGVQPLGCLVDTLSVNAKT